MGDATLIAFLLGELHGTECLKIAALLLLVGKIDEAAQNPDLAAQGFYELGKSVVIINYDSNCIT